jgi:hypothetical protein
MKALTHILDQPGLDSISSRDSYALASMLSGCSLGPNSLDVLIITATFLEKITTTYSTNLAT